MSVKASRDIEIRVIGALIKLGTPHNYKTQQALLQLNEDIFYFQDNREMFEIIKKRFLKQQSFDEITMLDIMQRANDSIYTIFSTSISGQYFSINSLKEDIETLITLSNLRKQLIIARHAIIDVDLEPIPSEAKRLLSDGLKSISEVQHKGLTDGETYQEIGEKYFAGDYGDIQPLKTGIEQFDNAVAGGIVNGGLVVIAAGAGVGKTGFALWLMHHLSKSQPDKQCLFFSLEMQNIRIMQRHASIVAGKPFQLLTDQEQFDAIKQLKKIKTTVFDSTRPDIEFIETTCRTKAMQQPLSIVVVDYLGLVQNSGKFESNHLKQEDVAQRLAALCLELDCVVIALSQTNRNPSSRAKDDRCPYPHDGADSSGPHRSSTLWLGVDRPELYNDCPSYSNQFVIKCRKSRYGELFNFTMAFNKGTFEVVPYGYFRKPIQFKSPNDYMP